MTRVSARRVIRLFFSKANANTIDWRVRRNMYGLIETYSKNTILDLFHCEYILSSSQDSFTTLRPLSYTDANVFILVYSTVNPSSLKSVVNKWLPEVSKVAPDTPCELI